ncbi:uncharacterized protein LOC131670863 [Phymastichus coffea]|uniref:uncharacterized protein LOC131670863 n=1 Tax=Phymastichus coffea TaxID=108790 RepID=UPI00273BDD21|nr:uncharacterized protein LOC131670863 [Phymastichus coffea]
MIEKQSSERKENTIRYYVLLASYVSFVVAPLVGLDFRIINNITDYAPGRKLVLQSSFPFEYYRTPYFELVQAGQRLATFFAGASISIPDNYFGALVFHLSAQFEILADRIELLGQQRQEGDDDDDDDDARLMTKRQFTDNVKAFVDRHVHLISIAAAVESSFCYVMLAQVFNTSLMLCCAGFQILGLPFASNCYVTHFFYLIFLFASLLR